MFTLLKIHRHENLLIFFFKNSQMQTQRQAQTTYFQDPSIETYRSSTLQE